jgi:hypothetical protein
MRTKSIAHLLALALVLLPTFITIETAQSASASPADFEQRKAEQLRRLDQRIAHLRDERDCVQGATAPATLRACHVKSKGANSQRQQPS